MNFTQIQLFKSLKRSIGDNEAQDLVNFIKSEISTEIMEQKKCFVSREDANELVAQMKQDKLELMLLMKQDKIELTRSIYMAGLMQFLAIMGGILGILALKG